MDCVQTPRQAAGRVVGDLLVDGVLVVLGRGGGQSHETKFHCKGSDLTKVVPHYGNCISGAVQNIDGGRSTCPTVLLILFIIRFCAASLSSTEM